MKTIEFIKKHGVDALTEQLGIKVRRERGLVVLNYDQIESPKTDPIVMECRGLILDEENDFEIVSRSYDRFFNLGEALNVMPEIDWANAKLYEKVDGSLIRIYNHKGLWQIATRGTAFADVPCGDWGITFRELVYKALDVRDDQEFQDLINESIMQVHNTYIFELTSVENRVVKSYEGYKLHFLGSRQHEGGCLIDSENEKEWLQASSCELGKRIHFPKEYSFATEEDCLTAVRELKDLDEGYVLYQDGAPICKVKSPAYVAVHHIRGEGLNPKRCAELVLSGEADEYLTYFPTDEHVLMPYMDAYLRLNDDLFDKWQEVSMIADQKEFALAVKDFNMKACLFTAKRDSVCPTHAFVDMRLNKRVEMLMEYIEQ